MVNAATTPKWVPPAASRLSAPGTATSGHLGAPRDAQEHDGDDEEQREQEERDGRSLGEVAPLDAGEEGQAGQDLRRIVRSAPRQDEDDDHVSEREDEPEERGHQHDGSDERQRDLEPVAPEP